jgi:hypothetical protein
MPFNNLWPMGSAPPPNRAARRDPSQQQPSQAVALPATVADRIRPDGTIAPEGAARPVEVVDTIAEEAHA